MVNEKRSACGPARARVRTAVMLGVSLVGLMASPAMAIVSTFTGDGGSDNWSDANNWSPAGVPGFHGDIDLAQSRSDKKHVVCHRIPRRSRVMELVDANVLRG